jgi:hypothetical protein
VDSLTIQRALRASGNGLTLTTYPPPLRGRKQMGGILHPHRTLRRNRVPASPLKWGGEQGETFSHHLLPCGLAFSTASLTGFGQRAHRLALSAKRCSLFFAPAPPFGKGGHRGIFSPVQALLHRHLEPVSVSRSEIV